MLEDVLTAIGNLKNKDKQVKLVEGRLFIKDSVFPVVSQNLRDIFAHRRLVLDKQSSLSEVKRYFSAGHFYLVEGKNVWCGYVLEHNYNGLKEIPVSSGRLINGIDNLVFGDPSIQKNTGISLFEKGEYIAEFDYGISKYKVHIRAFDRFVKNYRGNGDTSLRECLFEMYRCVKKAELSGDSYVTKLKKKLDKLVVKDRIGNRRRILANKKPSYLYFYGDKNFIFVRSLDEIFYCQPVYSSDRI